MLAVGLLAFLLPCVAVAASRGNDGPRDDSLPGDTATARELRARLVAEVAARDPQIGRRTLDALRAVPRHLFAPQASLADAYANHALPIGHGQTISQPFIVALMTDLLDLEGGERVLEIGSGSGYQAAVLAELGCEVYGIERIAALAEEAAHRLAALGYRHAHVRTGDGALGWPEHAPYDGILVTAAARAVPAALVGQLRPGGRLVAPIGPEPHDAALTVAHKLADGTLVTQAILPVAFVPLVTNSIEGC